jgi:hypothetical protein
MSGPGKRQTDQRPCEETMGNAKVRKANKTYPAQTFDKPKVMVATKEDISMGYIQRMNKLGFVMLILAIPDEAAHGPGSAQNISVYGNIADTTQQVAILREIADKIEDSFDPEKEKLIKPS